MTKKIVTGVTLAIVALVLCFAPLVSYFDMTAYYQGERVYAEVLDINFEERITQSTGEFLIDEAVTKQVTNVTHYTCQVTLHNTDNISGDFETEMIFYYENSIVGQDRSGYGMLSPNEVGTIEAYTDEPFDSWQLKVISITPDGIWKHPEKTYYGKETLLERIQHKGQHCEPDDSCIYETSGIYP
jgi:hypothetical protein